MAGFGGNLVEVLRRGFGASVRDPMHAEAVDAAARRELADLIAAYLRGEIVTGRFSTRCNALLDRTADPDIRTIILALQYCLEDRMTQPTWLSEEQWHAFLRAIAFLRTEHRLTRRIFPVPLNQKLTADGMLLLWVGTLPAFLVAWPVIGALWWSLRKAMSASRKRAVAAVAAFVPFRSEADWRAHEGVLASYGLPPYDPVRYRPHLRGNGLLMFFAHEVRTENPWTPEPWPPAGEIAALPVALILFQRSTVLPVIDECQPNCGEGREVAGGTRGC